MTVENMTSVNRPLKISQLIFLHQEQGQEILKALS